MEARAFQNRSSNAGFRVTPFRWASDRQNTFTPLQMAHAMATLANNGVVMKPHLVKMTEDPLPISER
jgi:membrane peptidoglycan carboxypeptidase